MVRFSCAVMETGSDGWLTTRLISSLPAQCQLEKQSQVKAACVQGISASRSSLVNGGFPAEDVPSLVCVSSDVVLCSVFRS